MTKEKFLYELIDNWLYMVSRQCIIIENYTQKDRTDVYIECNKILKKCMDFFDKISEKMNSGEYSQDEVDAKLEYIIACLKQETMRKFIEELKICMACYVSEIDELLEKYLCNKAEREAFSKNSLCCFMEEVRKYEAGDWRII